MTTEIVPAFSPFMPAMALQDAINRHNAVVEFVSKLMVEGTDYGKIPGTDKPTLLKPGAEKLNTLFGLSSRFTVAERETDWTGHDHNGEPFFYFLYRCQLWRNETLIAEGDGSCNSMEKKYRYRSAERVCPNCGKSAIIKGKPEYGGGWICFNKKGGCGSKFGNDDPKIVGQQLGQVINPDIADLVNTIQKMAQKRALIAATLLAVNASEFFTQDVEDMSIIEGDYSVKQPEAPREALERQKTPPPAPKPAAATTPQPKQPAPPDPLDRNGAAESVIDDAQAAKSDKRTDAKARIEKHGKRARELVSLLSQAGEEDAARVMERHIIDATAVYKNASSTIAELHKAADVLKESNANAEKLLTVLSAQEVEPA